MPTQWASHHIFLNLQNKTDFFLKNKSYNSVNLKILNALNKNIKTFLIVIYINSEEAILISNKLF